MEQKNRFRRIRCYWKNRNFATIIFRVRNNKKFRNMKIGISVIIATFTLTVSSAIAQNLPKKVTDVEIFDLDKNRTKLPHFGEKI